MCEIQDNGHRETERDRGEAVLSQGQTDHRKTNLMTNINSNNYYNQTNK